MRLFVFEAASSVAEDSRTPKTITATRGKKQKELDRLWEELEAS